jgi:hypothetical protein
VWYSSDITILEQFMVFAEALPADELQEVESLLASIMDSHSGEFELTAEELAELERRRPIRIRSMPIRRISRISSAPRSAIEAGS